jgi:hypothetical protein
MLAIPIFGEHSGILQLAGAGLVVLSGVLLALDARRNGRLATDA